MAAQLDYGYSIPKGCAGGLFDLSDYVIEARQNEADNGLVKAGLAVMVGEKPGHTIKPVEAGVKAEQIDGVIVAKANTEHDMDGKVVIRKNTTVNVMRKGKVWAQTANGANPEYNKTAYVVLSGADAGKFTDKAEGNVDIGAKFGNTTDDGIAVVIL